MSDLQEMGDEELLAKFSVAWERGGWSDLRNEILRRMSTGNPQNEKVQITGPKAALEQITISAGAGVSVAVSYMQAKRSDGRVQSEERTAWDELAAAYLLDGVAGVERWEAKRIAGRIQGEELQFGSGLPHARYTFECKQCGAVHEFMYACQVSENGAVPHGDDDNKS